MNLTESEWLTISQAIKSVADYFEGQSKLDRRRFAQLGPMAGSRDWFPPLVKTIIEVTDAYQIVGAHVMTCPECGQIMNQFPNPDKVKYPERTIPKFIEACSACNFARLSKD